MPIESVHLRMASRTRQARDRLINDPKDQHHEWIATTAFYEAVHLVEALFAQNNQHSHKHSQRNDDLEDQYPEIFVTFFKLYNESIIARYLQLHRPHALYSSHRMPQGVQKIVVGEWLETVKKLIDEKLSEKVA